MASVFQKFPPGFTPQTSGLSHYAALIERPVAQVIAHFESHRQEADAVLCGSYDKQYTPSTFVEEIGEKFRVGWFDDGRQHVQLFDTAAETITDYLLLSFGKGRLEADRPAAPGLRDISSE